VRFPSRSMKLLCVRILCNIFLNCAGAGGGVATGRVSLAVGVLWETEVRQRCPRPSKLGGCALGQGLTLVKFTMAKKRSNMTGDWGRRHGESCKMMRRHTYMYLSCLNHWCEMDRLLSWLPQFRSWRRFIVSKNKPVI
jgi:hypothetical protein